MKKKISEIQTYLTVLFVSSLLISNIVTSKQIQLPLNLTITGGIFVFPITYILSDVFSEIYGYRWSRITCYLAFSANLLMSLIFALVINTPSPVWFENGEAFKAVLGSTPRILFASLVSYVLGDFVNDRIFRRMKKKHNDIKGFELRAILSSIGGELTDSMLFFPLAFLGTMPFTQMLITASVQTLLKLVYEFICLPLTKWITKKVELYEQ